MEKINTIFAGCEECRERAAGCDNESKPYFYFWFFITTHTLWARASFGLRVQIRLSLSNIASTVPGSFILHSQSLVLTFVTILC